MARQKLNVAIIGYGFMGRAHSNAYRKVGNFFDLEYEPVMKVASARQQDQLDAFAANWGWQETDTDWRRVVERPDIDLVDICAPNNVHLEMGQAAAAAGKLIACEKPLAMDAAQGRQLVDAVAAAGKPNMVWFNYRRVPAIALAKQIVDEGRIGRVFHYRARYLQDWTISADVPQGGNTLWRLDKSVSGSGVTGDLLAHSIDTAMWLTGPIASVAATTETFVKERELQDEPGTRKQVEIDDACAFLARFADGAMATFESTRYARGRKNENYFEINGEKGSLAFNLENAHELGYFTHSDEGHLRGWRTIQVWDSDHPYMEHWWVPGCVDRLRTHLHQRACRLPRRPGERRQDVSRLRRRAGHPGGVRRGAAGRRRAPLGGPVSRFVLSCTTCATRGIEGDETAACFRYAPRAGFRAWGIASVAQRALGEARWLDAGQAARRRRRRSDCERCTEVYAPTFPADSEAAAEAAAEQMASVFALAEPGCGLPAGGDDRGHVPGAGGRGDTRRRTFPSPRRAADRARWGWTAPIAGIKRLLPLVEHLPVRLALEPHHGSNFSVRADFDRIFSEIDHPKVGITIDTGHFHRSEVDWRAFIRAYGDQDLEPARQGSPRPGVGAAGRRRDRPARLPGRVARGSTTTARWRWSWRWRTPRTCRAMCTDAHAYLTRLVREVTGSDPE